MTEINTDSGVILETLNNKVDLDCRNAKENIQNCLIPDFSQEGEYHTLPWTATDNGFVSVSDNNSSTTGHITINGFQTGDSKLYNSFQGFVRKGDIIASNAGSSGYDVYFWKL